MTQAERIELFSTPVLVFELPNMAPLNARLRELLIQEAATQPGLQESNVGGWHSMPDLAQRDGEPFEALMARLHDAAQSGLSDLATSRGAPDVPVMLQVHGWANVMGPGDYGVPHDHANAHWSWVYYVDAGDADAAIHPNSGALSFIDPRGASISGVKVPAPSTFSVPAAEGRMVMFPGFLRHYVHAYRGQRPRVSVACNARVARAS